MCDATDSSSSLCLKTFKKAQAYTQCIVLPVVKVFCCCCSCFRLPGNWASLMSPKGFWRVRVLRQAAGGRRDLQVQAPWKQRWWKQQTKKLSDLMFQISSHQQTDPQQHWWHISKLVFKLAVCVLTFIESRLTCNTLLDKQCKNWLQC